MCHVPPSSLNPHRTPSPSPSPYCGLRLRREGEGLDGGSAVEAEEDALGLGEGLGGEVVLWSEKVGEGGRRRERERRMMRDEVEET